MVTIKSQRKVLLSHGEDGYFVVEVPSLPGCISQGKTREEALANIEEAISLYIEVLQDRNEPIPEDVQGWTFWDCFEHISEHSKIFNLMSKGQYLFLSLPYFENLDNIE